MAPCMAPRDIRSGLGEAIHGASHNRQASSESPQQNSAAAPHSTSATTVTPGAATTTSGTVKTAEGAPVPSATIRLTNTDTNKSWVSWTDESGKFEFPNLPAGHYRVEASQLGFVKSSTEVQLPAFRQQAGCGGPPRGHACRANGSAGGSRQTEVERR